MTQVLNRIINRNKLTKITSAVILVVSVGALVYSGLLLLPKRNVSTAPGQQLEKSSTKKPKVISEAKLIESQLPSGERIKTLTYFVYFDTKEQGDCTLTLENESVSYEYESSTKTAKNATGCLPWNVSASNIQPGKYKITTHFESASGLKQTDVATMTI